MFCSVGGPFGGLEYVGLQGHLKQCKGNTQVLNIKSKYLLFYVAIGFVGRTA